MPTVPSFRVVFPCTVILLTLVFVATKPGLGDTITFQDIGGTITVDVTPGTGFELLPCGVDTCSGLLGVPGASVLFTTLPTPVFAVAEPNTSPQVVSDYLVTAIIDMGTLVRLDFHSSSDSAPLGLCSDSAFFPGGCEATENGGFQGGSITWGGPTGFTTDTIEFRTDFGQVPEPSTLLLVFTSLAAFGVKLRKKGTSLAN
jgi:hypothetical protein